MSLWPLYGYLYVFYGSIPEFVLTGKLTPMTIQQANRYFIKLIMYELSMNIYSSAINKHQNKKKN